MTSKLLFLTATVSFLCGLVFSVAASADSTPGPVAEGSPEFGVTLPPGYRNWQFVSIAHEEGESPRVS